MTIEHHPDTRQFTATGPGSQAELAYTLPAEGLIDFTHTFVPENQRGQGVAEELARAALTFARARHLKVKTSCEYMASFVQKHPADYADLLA